MSTNTRIDKDPRFKAAMQRLCSFLSEHTNQKVGFFGAGKHSTDMLESFPDMGFVGTNTLECFITDAPEEGKTFHSFPVFSPAKACAVCDIIVLCTDSFEAQMLTSIEKNGFTGLILVLYGQGLCLANVGMRVDELARACGAELNKTKYLSTQGATKTAQKITIFTSAKPFNGAFSRIQELAIQSWLLLCPKPEIMLMGTGCGYEKICEKYNLTHIKDIPQNQSGAPYLNHMFAAAAKAAKTDTLAYINADMIFTGDFLPAIERVREKFSRFLIIGQRYDLDMPDGFSFSAPQATQNLLEKVQNTARLHAASGIDYFIYNKPDPWPDMPEFALGRCAFDNWLVHTSIVRSIPVVDASRSITAIHQNHDYSHFQPDPCATLKTIQASPEAKRNIELAGKNMTMGSIGCAPWVLGPDGIKERNAIGEF